MHFVQHPLLDNLPPGSLAAAVPGRPGRPSTFRPDVIDKILDLVSETNLSLREICKRNADLPNIRTLYRWAAENDDFYEALYRALHLRCDDLAWECLMVAEDADRDYALEPTEEGIPRMAVNREHLSRTQMKLNEMHYIIEQLRPERYGPKRVAALLPSKTTEVSLEAPIARIEDHPQFAVLAAYRAAAEGK